MSGGSMRCRHTSDQLGSAIFSGLFAGGAQNMAAARTGSASSLPSPSTVRGTVRSGDSITINYNGDVFTNDEREATTLATVRAAGGNR